MRTLLVKTLEGLGVENTTEAADGDEALRVYQQNEFDLILLDWDMPGKTGLEVLQAIRAEEPEIPVIMVTAEKMRWLVPNNPTLRIPNDLRWQLALVSGTL